MRVLLILAAALSSLSAPIHAQVLGFDGDGFEACPRQVLSIASTVTWASQFGPYPQIPGPNVNNVPANGSAVLQFTAPASSQSGTLLVQNRPGTTGESAISIARCAGVFPVNPQSCIDGPSAGPGLAWTTNPAGSGCALEPGQTYYFNLTFGVETAPVPGQPWCSAGCSVSIGSVSR
jgi:hypothetical protein